MHLTLRIEFWGYCIPSPPTRATKLLGFEPAQAGFVCVAAISNRQVQDVSLRTVEFGLSLEARGFTHAPVIVPKELGRYQIEVFPHPAIVHLFSLNRILKYKKCTLAERR